MIKTSKVRSFIPIMIAILAIIIISLIGYVIYSFRGNYINYGFIDNSSEKVTLETATDADAIILNGILIGAQKQGKWVDANKYYDANMGATNLEVNVYSKTNLFGTFKTASLKRYNNKTVYTTLAKEMLPEFQGGIHCACAEIPKRLK